MMSILNMCMNIGQFNIDIKIKKDIKRKTIDFRRNYEQNKRIKNALEMKNNIEQKYYLNNILQ